MPVDEETALTSSALALENSNSATSNHSSNQQATAGNYIPATRGSISVVKKKKVPPKLLHPILDRVPLALRMGLNGFISNVLFMVMYNEAVRHFEHEASSSTIYAIVYLCFIPISHAIISLLVFGWPERYIRSLCSNAPVSLSAIALGASLTWYLDKVDFNVWVAEAETEYRRMLNLNLEERKEGDEFYSSLFVLLVTGIYTFVLSVIVNSPAESHEKKEL